MWDCRSTGIKYIVQECKFLSKVPRLKHAKFGLKLPEDEFERFGADIGRLTALTQFSLTLMAISKSTASLLGESLSRLHRLQILKLSLNLNKGTFNPNEDNPVEKLTERVFSKVQGLRIPVMSLADATTER